MAKFKTLPNYEYIKDGIHVVFNGEGTHETNVEAHIEALDNAKPFIERVDKPESKPKPQPKEKAEPTKKPATKKKK